MHGLNEQEQLHYLRSLTEKLGWDPQSVNRQGKNGWFATDPETGEGTRLGRLFESAVHYLLAKIEMTVRSAAFTLPDIEFTEDQETALQGIIDQVLKPRGRFVLKGYAGTGKTTLMQYLAKEIEKRHKRQVKIAFAAPSHQAVKVLKSKIPNSVCSTIHSMLRLKLKWKEGKQILEQMGSPDLDQFDALVLDESSMVGQELYQYLLGALQRAHRCSLIIVGDPRQLPPVSEAFSPCFTLPGSEGFELRKIRRQDGENPILFNSKKIRRMREFNPDRLDFYANDSGAFEKVSIGDWVPTVERMFSSEEFRNDTDFVRLLAWTNERVNFFNARIHTLLYGQTETPWVPGEMIRCQTQIGMGIININDECIVESVVPDVVEGHSCWKVELCNHLGITVEAYVLHENSRASWRAYLNQLAQDKNWFMYHTLAEVFAEIQHCYAMTVHRSQGSTFTNVLIDGSDLMRNRNAEELLSLFYVAITRPRRDVLVRI